MPGTCYTKKTARGTPASLYNASSKPSKLCDGLLVGSRQVLLAIAAIVNSCWRESKGYAMGKLVAATKIDLAHLLSCSISVTLVAESATAPLPSWPSSWLGA